MMHRPSFIACLAAALAPFAAGAQSYPAKTVRIVVPYAPGGNTDIVARMIAQRLSPVWSQQVVVDNRPGGATNIGTELVAKAPPDGYTLLMGGASNAINMTLFRKLPYDTLKDFAPIILCTQGANLLVTHPSLPVKTLRDLIALARARPGQLNFGSSGIGSSNQMAGELFKMMAKVNIVHVPYKGNAPALTDAVGGHVEMMFAGITSLVPMIEGGKLRAIAIGSKKRFPAVPSIPTFDESGLPGYEATTWFGLMAPVATPADIVAKVNADAGRILASPEVRDRLIADGQEPGGGTTANFARFIRDEIAKYAGVIRSAGIQGE